MANWLGYDVPKLGMGMMRLPTLDKETIDLEQVKRMVDAFIAAGFTYFDTAYGYHNEKSEGTVRAAVVERYPRDRFLLATKLPPWHLKEASDMQRVFDTQLERTGAGYFDFYMLHAVSSGHMEKLDSFDAWRFLREKKEQGLAKHFGMSFHDSAAVLDDILTKHPELEFVQLQINYADWEDEGVQSRLCYETARRHGKPVIVMEPVKGGSLAVMGDAARAVFTGARPDQSVASWAMRFCASLEGIITVLSGMSSLEQVEDNIRTMKDFEPLTDADREAIARVQTILAETPVTPCTDCKYCIESDGCPANIPIPSLISIDNHRRLFGQTDKGRYAAATREKGKASDCIQCANCESRCPQHIPIVRLMEEFAQTFE